MVIYCIWFITLISSLKLPYTPPFCYYKNNQMIYFIRHAESIFNEVADRMEHKYGPQYLDAEEYTS